MRLLVVLKRKQAREGLVGGSFASRASQRHAYQCHERAARTAAYGLHHAPLSEALGDKRSTACHHAPRLAHLCPRLRFRRQGQGRADGAVAHPAYGVMLEARHSRGHHEAEGHGQDKAVGQGVRTARHTHGHVLRQLHQGQALL